jgi:hypothetical protein
MVMGILGGAHQQQQRPLEGLVVCFEDRADEAKSREGTYPNGWLENDSAL